MKVKSIRRGAEDASAYCTGCKFSDHSVGAKGIPNVRQKARRHVEKTGHHVDVDVETRYRIKTI